VRRARPEDLAGGAPEDNAAMLERVLAGEAGPLADVTALNAGAALYAGGAAASIAEGVERARELIASGAVREKLAALRAFSVAMRRERGKS
jgi:anthranilate phosphoribosyltransferase